MYTRDFTDWQLPASLYLVTHALLTFLEANLHVQSTCFSGRNSVMRCHNSRWTHSPQTHSCNQNSGFWSYFWDFLRAQKIENLSESKNFLVEVFQITIQFVLAKKIWELGALLGSVLRQILLILNYLIHLSSERDNFTLHAKVCNLILLFFLKTNWSWAFILFSSGDKWKKAVCRMTILKEERFALFKMQSFL